MLLGLQNVTFEFGSRVIIQNANWYIQPQERIGLIGYNGTGKSTILKLLVGMYTPSKGEVVKNKNLRIGFLNQDLLSFSSNDNLLHIVLQAFENIEKLKIELTQLEIDLTNEKDEKKQEELAIIYSEKLNEINDLGGYDVEYKAKEVLTGLGFDEKDIHSPYNTFSGGWRMRVMLAKLILENPDILLLDEPTNHLDLPSIQWIEKYLQDYRGSIVIVSHDKYFLNRTVNKIVEVYQKRLEMYSGNYGFYESEKLLRQDIQRRAYENQQIYIKQQEAFIDRFKAKASKAAQAQSAIKRIDKLELIEDVVVESPEMNITFDVNVTPGKIISEFKNVTKQYPNKKIIENATIDISRGDKIGLLGANGIGKSTILRLIAQTDKYEGEIKLGHNVKLSFYAQHQLESLNLEHTILEEVKYAAPTHITEQMVRNMLGCFLFSGDDVDKKIKILSGGEKARVSLCKVILTQSNVLLLDEPTNHLDILSIQLLIDALAKYEGTIICVSHDRDFISHISNKIWYIENHILKEYTGIYNEWEEYMKNKPVSKNHITEKVKKIPNTPTSKTDVSKNKKLEQELENLEQKIDKLKQEIHTTEKQLVEATSTNSPQIDLMKKYSEIHLHLTEQLKPLEQEYEILFEKMLD